MNSPLVWGDDREYSLSSLYALNRIVREFRITIANEIPAASDLLIVPYLYNARTRTFQQMGFADLNWDPPKDIRRWKLKSILDLMRSENGTRWKPIRQIEEIEAFLKFVGGAGGAEKPRELIDRIAQLKTYKDRRRELDSNLGCSYWDWGHYYAHYKFPRDMFLNGIFWKLRARNPDIDSILLRKVDVHQDKSKLPRRGDVISKWRTWTKRRPINGQSSSDSWDISFEDHIQVTKSLERRGSSFAFALSEYFLSNRHRPVVEQRAKSTTIGLIPIYSTWLSGHGYGGISAVLQVQLNGLQGSEKDSEGTGDLDGSEMPPTDLEKKVLQKITDIAEILAVDLSAAAVQRAVAERIPLQSGLSEVFSYAIQYLQDWERISIETFGSNSPREFRRFNYTHDMKGGCRYTALTQSSDLDSETASGWDSSLLRSDHATGWSTGVALHPCDELHPPDPIQLEWASSQDGSSDGSRGDASKVSVSLRDLFSGIDTGSMRTPESATFTFPSNFRMPPRMIDGGRLNPLWKAYCNAVIRQQKELLAALAPRLIARQQALRTAVSAIMGRNMSHNIGSHVLARYSSAIAQDTDPAKHNKPDHRSDLLSYLQRRMDFLAEIATSDAAFWAQPLSLRDQISRLNYSDQRTVFLGASDKDAHQSNGCLRGPPNGPCKAPILLSYITGKETLAASVEYGRPERRCGEHAPCHSGQGYAPVAGQADTLFSCPGGEVGSHALFVILENIIRNSARHNGENTESGCATVSIFVEVDEGASTPDLIKINIIDPRTVLDEHGFTRGDSEELGLPERINNILRRKPILADDGKPNPQYWGVREMQICAHYLRGLPISELETWDYDGHALLEASKYPGPNQQTVTMNGHWCLKYELYLPRAKLLTVVGADFGSKHKDSLKFRRAGLQVLDTKTFSTWTSIAEAARGFSFLVVSADSLEKLEPKKLEDNEMHRGVKAMLPVRRLFQTKEEVRRHIDLALGSKGDLAWMETLHKGTGDTYKTRHESWAGRSAWGVWVLAKANASDLGDYQESAKPVPETIVWTALTRERTRIQPFKKEWNDTFANLKNDLSSDKGALGAAWIDHLIPEDFPEDPGMQQAPPNFADTYRKFVEDDPVRLNWICVEGEFSDSVHHDYLKSAIRLNRSQELMAAAYPRVAVLDERVQSASKSKFREHQLWKLWSAMGVWVPSRDCCNLDEPRLNSCRQFLAHPTERLDQLPIDILVVHLTILERLRVGGRFDDLDITLNELRKGTSAGGRHVEIVVVSGRGVPATAVQSGPNRLSVARYLPISALLENLVMRPSKLALMRVLWSARRPN